MFSICPFSHSLSHLAHQPPATQWYVDLLTSTAVCRNSVNYVVDRQTGHRLLPKDFMSNRDAGTMFPLLYWVHQGEPFPWEYKSSFPGFLHSFAAEVLFIKIESHPAQTGLQLTTWLRMNLNSWSSWLHFSVAGIIGIHCHAHFWACISLYREQGGVHLDQQSRRMNFFKII